MKDRVPLPSLKRESLVSCRLALLEDSTDSRETEILCATFPVFVLGAALRVWLRATLRCNMGEKTGQSRQTDAEGRIEKD
jgi:hypothetical protein